MFPEKASQSLMSNYVYHKRNQDKPFQSTLNLI